MVVRCAVFLAAACFGCLSGLCRLQSAEPRQLLYERDVQPLLETRCGKCHRDPLRKGDLDLLTMAGIRQGGESGEPLLADDPQESGLWQAIASEYMPPQDEPPLSAEERGLMQQWLAQGAPASETPPASPPPLNQHDVLPIVLLRCTTCHGPTRQDGQLDLRTPAAMRAGGQHGPALVPGDPDASPMIQRIESQACPPRELLLKFFVRRPSSAEVQTLRRWIAEGAVEQDIRPDVASDSPDPLVSDEDRQHWAFQPLRPITSGNSIDPFVAAAHHTQQLAFAPEADRDTLIRRCFFDLVGMPPTLEQWQRWHNDPDPRWYAHMIDALLASPQYGERWGRYWLDLAGYADSEGGTSADPLRPVAWKYRDYVIAAFNHDKAYDRFLLEQLAGDELVDYRHAEVVTQEMVDNLIATGFLRMGIDETGSRTMNFVPERLKVISDAITVVSSGLMGLTMECARCHSHKYDPIPHRDYYRFKAIFQGALDEHDWKSFQTRKLSLATPEHQQRVAAVNPPLEKELKRLTAQWKAAFAAVQLALLEHHYPEQSAADNSATLAALKVADNNRTLKQRTLVERLFVADLLPDDQQPPRVLQARAEVEQLDRQMKLLQRQLVPPLTIRALWDQGRPSPTYILRRGEHDKPAGLVGPGVPSVLTDGRTPFVVTPPFADANAEAADDDSDSGGPTGRRLAFARWLTSPDHPLTARVLVNRVWYHHFGAGLVKDLENFGRQSEPPSHPELLDWLAGDFVQHGWSIKRLHRLIMNSRTYRQSSQTSEEQLRRDPHNRWLSHMPIRRLDAEALRDSLLAVAGRLDLCGGGWPDSVSVDRQGQVTVDPTRDGNWRRSVYLQYRRTELPTQMDTFDYPQMGPNCLARNVSIVATQPLLMMNNAHIHELSQSLADRLLAAIPDGPQASAQRIEMLYRLALTRDPTAAEIAEAAQAVRELEAAWNGQTHLAWGTYCHTLLNSAAFIYVD